MLDHLPIRALDLAHFRLILDASQSATGEKNILNHLAHDFVEVVSVNGIGQGTLKDLRGLPAYGVFVKKAPAHIRNGLSLVHNPLQYLGIRVEDVETGVIGVFVAVFVPVPVYDLVGTLAPFLLMTGGETKLPQPATA